MGRVNQTGAPLWDRHHVSGAKDVTHFVNRFSHPINHNIRQTHIHACHHSHAHDDSKIKTLFLPSHSGTVQTLSLELLACVLPLRFERVSRVRCSCPFDPDVFCFLFFFPYSPFPPVLILCLYLVYDPVLEYRDKLFTHSNQKPGSKERVHQQGTVHLSHSVCLHLPPALLLLFAFTRSLTRSCTAICRAYRHLVRRLTNFPCGFSLRGLWGFFVVFFFSHSRAAALMWAPPLWM